MNRRDHITKNGNGFRVRRMVNGIRSSHTFTTYEEAQLFSLTGTEEHLLTELCAVREQITKLIRTKK